MAEDGTLLKRNGQCTTSSNMLRYMEQFIPCFTAASRDRAVWRNFDTPCVLLCCLIFSILTLCGRDCLNGHCIYSVVSPASTAGMAKADLGVHEFHDVQGKTG